jgi:hypothetical protein
VLQDSFDFPILDDWGPEESTSYVLSSSDGEDFDGDVFLTPVNDIDLPSSSASNNDALKVAAHRLVTIGRGHKKHRQVCCRTCANGFVLYTLLCQRKYMLKSEKLIFYCIIWFSRNLFLPLRIY